VLWFLPRDDMLLSLVAAAFLANKDVYMRSIELMN